MTGSGMTGSGARDGLLSCDRQLLEQAVRYALTATEPVRPHHLSRPTPCRGWDLAMLLLHAGESLAALAEGLRDGSIALQSQPRALQPADDPAVAFRSRARTLLVACGDRVRRSDVVAIADCPIATGALVAAGSLEIAVHGWDVAQAYGNRPEIPPALAVELLDIAPELITGADREQLFAPPAIVATTASPGDRLAAFLGRSPHRPA
jgi:uncharacterized protein (TIGR03086 family)